MDKKWNTKKKSYVTNGYLSKKRKTIW